MGRICQPDGVYGFSVQKYCDRRLISVSRIPNVEFLRRTNQNPVDFYTLFRARIQREKKKYKDFLPVSAKIFHVRGNMMSEIQNEYVYIAHALGGTSGNLTQYFHCGSDMDFGQNLSFIWSCEGKPSRYFPRLGVGWSKHGESSKPQLIPERVIGSQAYTTLNISSSRLPVRNKCLNCAASSEGRVGIQKRQRVRVHYVHLKEPTGTFL